MTLDYYVRLAKMPVQILWRHNSIYKKHYKSPSVLINNITIRYHFGRKRHIFVTQILLCLLSLQKIYPQHWQRMAALTTNASVMVCPLNLVDYAQIREKSCGEDFDVLKRNIRDQGIIDSRRIVVVRLENNDEVSNIINIMSDSLSTFRRQNLNIKIGNGESIYGIVEGSHRVEALCQLMQKNILPITLSIEATEFTPPDRKRSTILAKAFALNLTSTSCVSVSTYDYTVSYIKIKECCEVELPFLFDFGFGNDKARAVFILNWFTGKEKMYNLKLVSRRKGAQLNYLPQDSPVRNSPFFSSAVSIMNDKVASEQMASFPFTKKFINFVNLLENLSHEQWLMDTLKQINSAGVAPSFGISKKLPACQLLKHRLFKEDGLREIVDAVKEHNGKLVAECLLWRYLDNLQQNLSENDVSGTWFRVQSHNARLSIAQVFFLLKLKGVSTIGLNNGSDILKEISDQKMREFVKQLLYFETFDKEINPTDKLDVIHTSAIEYFVSKLNHLGKCSSYTIDHPRLIHSTEASIPIALDSSDSGTSQSVVSVKAHISTQAHTHTHKTHK